MNVLVKKQAYKDCVVPQNSVANLAQLLPGLVNTTHKIMENSYDRTANTTKCPHCENMAKNFLYLESLMRNNYNQELKCNLCQSSLKYLQYVNRNIMQTFGNFDSIVQAAKAFAVSKPTTYSINNANQKPAALRSKGGAIVSVQKSHKSLKTTHKQKSNKSLKSSKLLKAIKSSSKSKSLSKLKTKSGAANKGKMVLKRKYKPKSGKLSKLVRSASQYQNLRGMRSKLSTKGKLTTKAKLKKPIKSQSHGISWGLLKKNLPKKVFK